MVKCKSELERVHHWLLYSTAGQVKTISQSALQAQWNGLWLYKSHPYTALFHTAWWHPTCTVRDAVPSCRPYLTARFSQLRRKCLVLHLFLRLHYLYLRQHNNINDMGITSYNREMSCWKRLQGQHCSHSVSHAAHARSIMLHRSYTVQSDSATQYNTVYFRMPQRNIVQYNTAKQQCSTV